MIKPYKCYAVAFGIVAVMASCGEDVTSWTPRPLDRHADLKLGWTRDEVMFRWGEPQKVEEDGDWIYVIPP